MIGALRHLLGWMVSAFRSREDLVLENLALRQQFTSSAHATTSPSINGPAPAVLDCVENVLVRVEETSRFGHPENGRELASGGVSFVLDLGLQS